MLHGGGDSEGHGVDHYGVELQELLIQPETQPNCNNRVIWHWDDEMDSYKYSGLPENSEISRRTTDALMERFFNELKQKPNYGLRKMNEFVNTTLMIISALWLICIIYEYFCFCCKLFFPNTTGNVQLTYIFYKFVLWYIMPSIMMFLGWYALFIFERKYNETRRANIEGFCEQFSKKNIEIIYPNTKLEATDDCNEISLFDYTLSI